MHVDIDFLAVRPNSKHKIHVYFIMPSHTQADSSSITESAECLHTAVTHHMKSGGEFTSCGEMAVIQSSG